MNKPIFPLYAGYLFDLDGTLVDSAPDLHEALNATLAFAGADSVDESLTRHWVGHGSEMLINEALRFQGRKEKASKEMVQFFLDDYHSHIATNSKLYPGVERVLDTLRTRGAKLAVVTNKYENLAKAVLHELNLNERIDVLVANETAPKPKPSADPALAAVKKLGLNIEDVLFIGDAPPDVGCARAAGCPIVCVSYGYNQGTNPKDLGADHVIDHLTDLLPA